MSKSGRKSQSAPKLRPTVLAPSRPAPKQDIGICEQLAQLSLESNSQQVLDYISKMSTTFDDMTALILLCGRLNKLQGENSRLRRGVFELKLMGDCATIKCLKCALRLTFLKQGSTQSAYNLEAVQGKKRHLSHS